MRIPELSPGHILYIRCHCLLVQQDRSEEMDASNGDDTDVFELQSRAQLTCRRLVDQKHSSASTYHQKSEKHQDIDNAI